MLKVANPFCFGVLFSCMAVSGMAAESVKQAEVIAHRGESSIAPENTVASVELAWKQGADSVEIDVYLTTDDKLVVCHDDNAKRTTGKDLIVANSTSDVLHALDAGKWKGPQWEGVKMPLLDDVLKAMPQDAKHRLFIEVKNCRDQAAAAKFIAVLKKYLEESGLPTEQIAIVCFAPEVIAEAKRVIPQYKAYLLRDFKQNKETKQWSPTAEEIIAKAREVKADGLDLLACEPLDAAMMKKFQQAGLDVYIWTVDAPEIAQKFVDIGVVGVTTNCSGVMKKQLTGCKK